MNRDAAPPAAFWQITIGGDRIVYLYHVDRTSKSRAEAELEFWRGMFGEQAKLMCVYAGEDIVIQQMAQAIALFSKDGSGVTRQHLEALGFASDLVARRWNDAVKLFVDTDMAGNLARAAEDSAAQRIGSHRCTKCGARKPYMEPCMPCSGTEIDLPGNVFRLVPKGRR